VDFLLFSGFRPDFAPLDGTSTRSERSFEEVTVSIELGYNAIQPLNDAGIDSLNMGADLRPHTVNVFNQIELEGSDLCN
jgi:hypothetical protein